MSNTIKKSKSRIILMLLLAITMLIGALMLTGCDGLLSRRRPLPLPHDEVIFLVQVSHSTRYSQNDMDNFIYDALSSSPRGVSKAIIIFGREPILAADFSQNASALFAQYLAAVANARQNERFIGGTDISSALLFASSFFAESWQRRIVLLSNGFETDGNVIPAIMSLAAEGVTVDTVPFFNQPTDFNELQLINIILPDHNIAIDDAVVIGAVVQSSFNGTGSLRLYNNGVFSSSMKISFRVGLETFFIEHIFESDGFNEMVIIIDNEQDTVAQNNVAISFVYIGDDNRYLDNQTALIPFSVQIMERNFRRELRILANHEPGYVFDVMVYGPDAFRKRVYLNENLVGAFFVERFGVYRVDIVKKARDGELIAEHRVFVAFSWSSEFDAFRDWDTGKQFLEDLAHRGNGRMLEESAEVWRWYEAAQR